MSHELYAIAGLALTVIGGVWTLAWKFSKTETLVDNIREDVMSMKADLKVVHTLSERVAVLEERTGT